MVTKGFFSDSDWLFCFECGTAFGQLELPISDARIAFGIFGGGELDRKSDF
jgi:hypothetical protein